jgi:hypothetical protein
MLVALSSLRKVYKDDITILLASNDGTKKSVFDAISIFDVNVKWFPLDRICRRNLSYSVKPSIISLTPYDETIFTDTDVLFRSNPAKIFDIMGDRVFLTQFSKWTTDKRVIKKRIKRFEGLIPAEQLKNALTNKPAINTGVIGFSKNNLDFMKEWIELTLSAKGTFIVDEIACQCMFFKHNCFVSGSEWNSSARYDKCADAKIIHFHGKKYKPESEATKLWLSELKEVSQKIDIERWKVADKVFSKVGVPVDA